MKNYIEYVNGRKEEIVFYREFKNGGLMFATSTDLYLACPNHEAPAKYDISTFYMEKPYLMAFKELACIAKIVIDDTDQYDYQIMNGDDMVLEGYVQAKRNASDAEIRKQITDTLNIMYKKHPYLR